MLVFRSFAIGLLAACFVVLAYRPSVQVFVPPAAPVGPPAAAPRLVASEPAATIVDVGHGVPASEIGSLVRLRPGERIVGFDGNIAAAEHYLDLSLEGPRGHRRVLVLFH